MPLFIDCYLPDRVSEMIQQYLYAGVYYINGSLAVILNVITIVCFILSPKLLSASNIVVTGLTVSDLLHGLTLVVSFPLQKVLTEWPASKYVCQFSMCAHSIALSVQLFMLQLISIWRYKSLRAQLGQGRVWTRPTAIILVVSCWFFMAIVVAVGILTTDSKPGAPCGPLYFFHPLLTVFITILFISTTLVTLTFYSLIARIILTNSNQVRSSELNSTQIQRRQAEIRVTKMLGMVVGLFFVLYSPAFIMLAVRARDPSLISYQFMKVVLLVHDINYWINPIIYIWRSKEFRDTIRKRFRRCVCSNRET